MTSRIAALATALALTGCHHDGAHDDLGAVSDLSATIDLASDAAVTTLKDGGSVDASFDAAFACTTPSGLGRAAAWARDNGLMLSGLNVSMGVPTAATVGDYFDAFHANTVHLWQTGLPTEVAGWSAVGHAGFRYVSWVAADGTSSTNGQPLGGAPPLAGRIGYQIGDEPQDAPTLTTMLASAHAIRQSDADALTIINVNDTAADGALVTTAATSPDVDVISYDHYTYGSGEFKGLGEVRAAALAAGKSYWRYARAYYDKGSTPSSTDVDLRWDAYVGAVYGFSGLTWFLYQVPASNTMLSPLLFTTAGDFTSTKTEFYAAAAALNAELVRIQGTLTHLRSADVRYVAALSFLQPSGTTAWSAGAGNDPYLTAVTPSAGATRDASVGFFRDDCDSLYVMLQNVSHPSASFPNATDQPSSFHVAFDFSSGGASVDPTMLTSLDPATGALVPIALTGSGAQRSAEISVPAGGIVLWKYADGRPFAQ